MVRFECRVCEFGSDLKRNYERHLKTKKHHRKMENTERNSRQTIPVSIINSFQEEMTQEPNRLLSRKEIIQTTSRGSLTFGKILDDIYFDKESVLDNAFDNSSGTQNAKDKISKYMKFIPKEELPAYCTDKTRNVFYVRCEKDLVFKKRNIWFCDELYTTGQEVIKQFFNDCRKKYHMTLIEVKNEIETTIDMEEKVLWTQLVMQSVTGDLHSYKQTGAKFLGEMLDISLLEDDEID